MKKWKNEREGLCALKSIVLKERAGVAGGITKYELSHVGCEAHLPNIPARLHTNCMTFFAGQTVFLVYKVHNELYLATEKPVFDKRDHNGTISGITGWWIFPYHFDLL